MKGWEVKSFKDIVQFPPKVILEKRKVYPFIPMDQIKEGYKYVTANQEKEWKGTGGAKFENGDTLFARITPCLQNGKISQVKDLENGKGFGSTEFFIFRGVEGVSDSDYIYYLSQTEEFRKYAVGSMVGASGRQRADATFVGNFVVNLPPLPTQRRIASILSAYDDLIEINLRRIKLLEELAQRTYEEWFVKFTINGEKMPLNEETGLPEGWERKKLGEAIQFEIGGGWGNDEQNYEFTSPGYVIRGTDMNNLILGNIENIPYRFHKASNMASRKIQHGDIIFEVSGGSSNEGVGKTVLMVDKIINQFDDDIMCASFCKLVRPKEVGFSTYLFLLLRFLRRAKTTEIWEIRSASNIVNYNWTSFLKFQDIIMPDNCTLEEFNSIANIIFKQIYTLANQNRLLKESRAILLPRLMGGVIGVEGYSN
jgi:type I restriction enzyme, S subunit